MRLSFDVLSGYKLQRKLDTLDERSVLNRLVVIDGRYPDVKFSPQMYLLGDRGRGAGLRGRDDPPPSLSQADEERPWLDPHPHRGG